MTERSAQGSSRSRRGHQNHPKNVGIRTSNVPTSEIIQALRDGRSLETLFHQPPQPAAAPAAVTPTVDNRSISKRTENCDESSGKEVDGTSCNVELKAKRNSSSSSLNSTPSEKSEKKSSRSTDGKKKRVKTAQADISRSARPAADGAEDVTDEDDAETAELAKLRCTSERTEVIAEREHRRQKKCADYPGLAFGRSIFSSDSMMKFNIIRNELQNIMNNQLRRVRVSHTTRRRRAARPVPSLTSHSIILGIRFPSRVNSFAMTHICAHYSFAKQHDADVGADQLELRRVLACNEFVCKA